MKTLEETKKGLECCGKVDHCKGHCPYDGLGYSIVACTGRLSRDALSHIQQLETSYSQVSKALCGKENASLNEVLEAVSQVKAERAVAINDHEHAVAMLEKMTKTKDTFKHLFIQASRKKKAVLDALPRWRSMKKDPPEVPSGVTAELLGKEYLVCEEGAEESTTLRFFPDGSWRDEYGNHYRVAWWMPKPEAKRDGV
ncbi:MAG: hypothetical protein J6K72_08530 [Clostridia bacterium]|nr:hypothetical protein [Clostridia bacterium]